MTRNTFFSLLVYSFLCLLPVSALAQCPMCKQNVESARNAGSNNVGNGLNTGILYMLVAPYILVSTIGFLWYKNYKKQQKFNEIFEAENKPAFGDKHTDN